ncbi:Transcription terminating nucleic-acid-binding protein [Sphingomonas sp. EC-HK361]|uniref:DUF448 domain-containing protein n=1 Tax=Sphingomonas sp. EC-HK361 TaxID=2038397 RepID=UPI00125B8E7A|nr:DUF448 domain-containing protein [Sphingomonas sp. EC-HK361]VVS98223.1 Transcription terminating nucleic-acid-binding protein [Sphingomonas sp. EC-HK361]
MRSRDNEPVEGPERSCILTRERSGQDRLVRLALAPDGQVLPDVRARAPGRGAWIGVDRAALESALAKGKLRGALARAFKANDFALPDDLPARIAAALERNALDRLGLESRSGNLLTGSDRIEDAARSGKLHALYHAADAAADGARKLAQAWRVGSDREGSDLKGLALPASRTILAMALGRENVVHIGVTDRLAAMRLGDALDRWLHFIGSDLKHAPCETASQGASATGIAAAQATELRPTIAQEDFE